MNFSKEKYNSSSERGQKEENLFAMDHEKIPAKI
jgi:hypothetical protein